MCVAFDKNMYEYIISAGQGWDAALSVVVTTDQYISSVVKVLTKHITDLERSRTKIFFFLKGLQGYEYNIPETTSIYTLLPANHDNTFNQKYLTMSVLRVQRIFKKMIPTSVLSIHVCCVQISLWALNANFCINHSQNNYSENCHISCEFTNCL